MWVTFSLPSTAESLLQIDKGPSYNSATGAPVQFRSNLGFACIGGTPKVIKKNVARAEGENVQIELKKALRPTTTTQTTTVTITTTTTTTTTTTSTTTATTTTTTMSNPIPCMGAISVDRSQLTDGCFSRLKDAPPAPVSTEQNLSRQKVGKRNRMSTGSAW